MSIYNKPNRNNNVINSIFNSNDYTKIYPTNVIPKRINGEINKIFNINDFTNNIPTQVKLHNKVLNSIFNPNDFYIPTTSNIAMTKKLEIANNAPTDRSLYLNPINQYASVVLPSAVSSSNITIEAWIKVDTTNDQVGIISCGNIKLAMYNYKLAWYEDSLGIWLVGSTMINDRAWHHIAKVCTNTYTRLYVDGVAQALFEDGVNPTETAVYSANYTFNTITVGKETAGQTNAFGGFVDELKVWNIAKSDADILNNFKGGVSPTATGLVSYYKSNVSTTTNFVNLVSGGVNMPLFNSPSLLFDAVPYCVKFQSNLVNTFANSSTHYSYSVGTIEAWVKLVDENIDYIIAKPNAFELNIVSQKLNTYINGVNYNSNTTIPLNQWVHIAFVFNGASSKFYLNGRPDSDLFTHSILDQTSVFGIACGTRLVTTIYISECRIWNTARTDAEILNLYNVVLTGAVGGLTGYWRVNEGNGNILNPSYGLGVALTNPSGINNLNWVLDRPAGIV